MKRFAPFLALALASCALKPLPALPPPSAGEIHALRISCVVDRIGQPILVDVAGNFGPVPNLAGKADSLLLHPLVLAACAKLNAKPVAIVAKVVS